MFAHWSMKRLLVTAMLISGLSPLIAVSVLSGYQATQTLQEEAKLRLSGMLEGRKAHMEDYLGNLIDTNATVASGVVTVQALRDFKSGFNLLARESNDSSNNTKNTLRQVEAYYNNVFSPAYLKMPVPN